MDSFYSSNPGNVYSGQTRSDILVSGQFATLEVFSGGRVISTTVDGGGTMDVSGIADNTIVSGGGIVDLEFGGETSGTIVLAGGSQDELINQGTRSLATDTIVSSGGFNLLSGGDADATTVSSGGEEVINTGVSTDARISAGGSQVLLAGSTEGTDILSGGYQLVSGGRALLTTVESGGLQSLVGGVASGTEVQDGGRQAVLSGGLASGTTVLSGGIQVVRSGGTASASIVMSGGLIEQAGGTLSNTTFEGGTFEITGENAVTTGLSLAPGGLAEVIVAGYATVQSSTVGSGAEILISSNAYGDDDTINAGGIEQVEIRGSVNYDTVLSGGTLDIAGSGGMVGDSFGIQIEAGGVLNNSGDDDSSDIAGVENVYNAGTTFDETVQSGGYLQLFDGHNEVSTIASGGQEFVFSGSFASSDTVASGGILDALDGGLVSATAVNAGGVVQVESGGVASRLVIDSGGVDVISASGVATRTTVLSGGTELVSSGGLASSTVVSAGGVQFLSMSGNARGTMVQGGQVQVDGGTGVGIVVAGGGSVLVSSGSLLGTVLGAGGSDTALGPNTYLEDTTVSSGGVEIVSSGGSAFGAIVSAGGEQIVFAGGSASETTVRGGTLELVGDATVSGVTFTSGTEILASGAQLTSATLTKDGLDNLILINGGIATSAGVGSAATLTVSAGGVAIDTQLAAGGSDYVSAGGLAKQTAIGGGVEDVFAGGKSIDASAGSGGFLQVFGSASGALIGSGAQEIVFSGGRASETSVASGGVADAQNGGVLSRTTIAAGAVAQALSGGLVTGSIVSGSGAVVISSGGSATQTELHAGGAIDLQSFAFASGGTASLDGNDQLTISEGGRTTTEQLAGSYSGDHFNLSLDGVGGTDITVVADVACFLAGTMIATPDGIRAIETLRAGDLVLTSEGVASSIRWLGRQTVATRFADPFRVAPIRIRKGALADNMPVRDLLVSRDHALMVDGVFVQAAALVNGVSIVREDADMPATFVYFHIELSDHLLILAEGVPAETFIDNVDRLGFDNWDEYESLGDHAAEMTEMPLARAKSHRQVPQALRARLVTRGYALYGADAAAVA